MNLAVIITALAATSAFAADVSVIGARSESHVADSPQARVNVIGAQKTDRLSVSAGVDIKIASKDLMNRPTALLNKNTLVTHNNIFIARSNLVFTQSDRLALRKRVQEALETDAGTAVLTKDVLRAVSSPTSDATLQTKASAVVAAKNGDQAMLLKRIADFVDAVAERNVQSEQSIQSQSPRGIVMMVGTKDLLRQPTAVINKNIVMSDNQVNIARSHLTPRQNDQVVLGPQAKVGDAILPASAVRIGTTGEEKTDEDSADNESSGAQEKKKKKKMPTKKEAAYRMGFVYPKDGEADSVHKEQWGLWGPGWGFGWRYPLSYWNLYGAGLYGGHCGLGFAMGQFYYC